MTARVLIVSPDAGFGGLIQQTLEKVGSYEPVLVSTGRQALELAEKASIDLAILDADTADLSYIDLGLTLQANDPEMQLLLIPSDDTVKNIEIKGLTIGGYLTKPFYLPDLVEIVGSTLAEDVEDDEPAFSASEDSYSEAAPGELQAVGGTMPIDSPASPATQKPWLRDVEKAAQHLARLSLSTSAQAALILNRGRLWAYAGQLSKAAAEELAQIVQYDWERGNNSNGYAEGGQVDLARFIHLDATGGEYLLYATAFEGEMLLVLAFDTRTPFSKIHTQANNLVRALISPPIDVPETRYEPEPALDDKPLQSSDAGVDQHSPALEDKEWYWEFEPEPEPAPQLEEGRHVANLPEAILPGMLVIPNEASGYNVPSLLDNPLDANREDEPDAEATKPVRVNQVRSLRSLSPVVYDINYACVILPRLPEHHLTGDLSENLSGWMRRLSLAFGWRLEYLAVRPGWLQWIACVAPETSPIHVVQLVRQRTSQLIFADFPRYSVENPSEDFWAPGYLLVTSTKPLPGEMVQQFIRQTRLRQGISARS
jgi:CheY-like chemotaxis protein/REP element-mobilizing transposase RayT